MNWLDFVFIAILGLSVIISLFRGLIKEVLSLIIWASSFWLAYHFVDKGAATLSPYIEVPSARHLIAFVAIFITSLIVGGMLNWLVGKLIKKTGLSASDRFFGMFFGALRGLVLIVVITFFVRATPLSEDPWWQQSQLAPHFSKIAEWARQNMPDEFANYFSNTELRKAQQRDEKDEKGMESLIKNLVTTNQQKSQDNSSKSADKSTEDN